MAEAKPRLVAIGGESGAPGGRSAPGPARPPVGRRSFWLIVLLLGLAVVALVIQTQRVGSLASQVEDLSADLGRARAELAAYQGRMDEIRGAVGQLNERLEALRALVGRDPEIPLPEAPEAPEASAEAP